MQNDPVTAARTLLGVPFRLHGRGPAFGLDCVGLVVFAYGLGDDVPTGYSLRSRDPTHWEQVIQSHNFIRRRAGWRRGDLLVLRPGPLQIHLGIWTGQSLIHADAGLGRIVETPGVPRWPVLSAWLRCKRRP